MSDTSHNDNISLAKTRWVKQPLQTEKKKNRKEVKWTHAHSENVVIKKYFMMFTNVSDNKIVSIQFFFARYSLLLFSLIHCCLSLIFFSFFFIFLGPTQPSNLSFYYRFGRISYSFSFDFTTAIFHHPIKTSKRKFNKSWRKKKFKRLKSVGLWPIEIDEFFSFLLFFYFFFGYTGQNQIG